MNNTYRQMLRCALAAVPMACAVLLSSCYGDEADGCPPDAGSAVPVKVNVSAGEIGDLNASRAGGDANAEDGEFINTLHVYIVSHEGDNALRTFMNLSPDLTGSALAQKGNLTEWTSEPLTLIPGTYTFYAFANIEEYEGEYGTEGTAVGIQETTGGQLLDDNFVIGQVFSDEDINSFRLFNPAGKIDLDGGKFIPMSAKGELTITSDLNASGGIIVDLPLERLVSKVRMTVGDGADVTDNSEVTFSGYSENVPLMEGSTSSDYGDRSGEYTAKLSDAEDTADGRQLSFYVNETLKGAPFTVTLNTGNAEGISSYTAQTDLAELPRNSIYPLTLTFDDFGFNLTPTAWLYVTGVPYAVYYNVGNNNVLTVEIAIGSYFNFAPGNMSDSDGEYQTTWSWTVPEQQYEGLSTEINQNEIQGNIPAGQGLGNKYTLYLNGKWTGSNGHSYDRTYTVIVDACHDEAWAIANRIQGGSTTRGAKAGNTVYMLAPEYLNMFKTN